ncbi:MAG: hypothetical protein IKQ69_04910 [Oscillospiraceae bacterium]|nr:hypothetical protein [Oscillospiraceae bacterium]
MKKGKNILMVCALLALVVVVYYFANGPLNEYVTNYVANEVTNSSESKIFVSDEYRQFEKYQTEGILAENGMYPTPAPIETREASIKSHAIQITFAKNSFLNCVYYTDEETKAPIVSNQVLLSPGESIFVASIEVNNQISNLYDFSMFRIWSYDQDGNKSNKPYREITTRTGLLLTVPENFTGTGFAIEPLGFYTTRQISARAFYRDNGREIPLPGGIWKVNNESFSGSTKISPVDSYTIVYDYSAYDDDYYFVSSTPECWYSKESDHTVIFREVSSNEQETEFSVEMHPYITMKVTNSCLSVTANWWLIGDKGAGIIKSIIINGDEYNQGSHGQKSFDVDKKLKTGDSITIRVGNEYKITGTGVNVGTAIPLGSNAEHGYEYTFYVPDTNKGISIEITERNSNAEGIFQGYNLANADITITRANGVVLKAGEELPGDDDKVTIRITPHAGYYINGYTEDDFSFVKKNIKFSRLEQDIGSILNEHKAIHFLSLTLVFSDEAGTYTYKLDGKQVTEAELHDVRIGQTLKVEFTANSGYNITHSWFGAEAVAWARTGLGGNDTISESVDITADMDGMTVNRETFGIVVEREG